MAVGEYAESYGFPLPNLVFIRWEYLWSRLGVEWRMKDFQKIKILGIEC